MIMKGTQHCFMTVSKWGLCAVLQISSDPRFHAISEQQRRDMFQRFVASMEEPKNAAASLLPVASAESVATATSESTHGTSHKGDKSQMNVSVRGRQRGKLSRLPCRASLALGQLQSSLFVRLHALSDFFLR